MLNQVRHLRTVVVAVVSVLGCLALAKPGHAATISLNARGNCDGYQIMGTWIYFCHFSGSVTFDPNHTTPAPDQVECYVSGTFSGVQSVGFTNIASGVYGYDHCCSSTSHPALTLIRSPSNTYRLKKSRGLKSTNVVDITIY